jgi:hypothetical protein
MRITLRLLVHVERGDESEAISQRAVLWFGFAGHSGQIPFVSSAAVSINHVLAWLDYLRPCGDDDHSGRHRSEA